MASLGQPTETIIIMILLITNAALAILFVDLLHETARRMRVGANPAPLASPLHPSLTIGFVRDEIEMERQINRLARLPASERQHFAGAYFDSLGAAGRRLAVAVVNDDWLKMQQRITGIAA